MLSFQLIAGIIISQISFQTDISPGAFNGQCDYETKKATSAKFMQNVKGI